MDFVMQDAQTAEREEAEVFEAVADQHQAWMEQGGVDEMASYYTSTDDFTF